MLIGLPALLGPELLFTLRAMGHGDELAIVDGNYPAEEHGRRVIRADGLELIPVLDAVLQVLPVDDFVAQAIFRATVKGDPTLMDPVHQEIIDVCARRAPGFAVVPLAGDAFYDRVRAAHTIIATSEPRLYGNVIVRKGVIYPERSGT
ncbi:MAG: transporter [Mesorhizobium sp. SCN 65-20]|nr:MAG: transporter [Mesorhizobium sp. SCN 65-20]